MGAPKGNEFWKARAKSGRDKIFSTPDELWNAANEYFQWVADNPLYETKPFHNQGEIVMAEVPLMRAMTITGLCIFLGVNKDYLTDFKDSLKDKNDEVSNDFSRIINDIYQVIWTQKFEGASANQLNSNIIARDLGLADKQNVEAKNINANVNHTIPDNTSPKDAAQIYMDAIKGN